MRFFGITLGSAGDDAGEAFDAAPEDRLTREIKGTILGLLAVFILVSLASHIPNDNVSIELGSYDNISNFGGIVGAVLSQWLLGSVGINGFFFVLFAACLSYCSFVSIPIGRISVRLAGAVFATLLMAITCNLAFGGTVEPGSLFRGGWMGEMAGTFLRYYFNTGGALLILGGGFLITLLMTTGVSLTRAADEVFSDGEEEDDTAYESASHAPVVAPAPRPAAAPAKPARKRKKKATTEEDSGDEDTAQANQSPAPQLLGPTGERLIIPFTGQYSVPSIRLLKDTQQKGKRLSRGQLRDNARKLVEHLLSFQITGEVTGSSEGPALTTYEFKPSAGVKLSKMANLQDDLGIVMGTAALRIMAPIPGKTVVGIEVPRPSADVISLKEVLREKIFYDKKIRLPVALGKTTTGESVVADLASMPHLLVAGSTGSGKSVFVNSMIMSFLLRMTPHQLRMILVDPKMLELSIFDGIPHLVAPVITDNKIAIDAMNWAVGEMERRYALMAKSNSKNIDSYNSKQKNALNKLPFLVIVVDELADMMMSGGKEVELSITRLAQKARAAGIHLVLATQRPSTDVVTGLIKANIPSRLSFKVPSGVDSRTVLDASGAEDLMGRGDSLIVQPGIPLRRLHGTYVTEEELARVTTYVKGGRNHHKYFLDFKTPVAAPAAGGDDEE